MRFPRLLASTAMAALIMGASASASAQDLPFDFSTTVTVTNDYLFRGVTQTNGDAAAQASLDVSMDNGFFAGVWGSNVEFEGSDADFEIDLYAGYGNEVGDFSYSVTGLYYLYTGASGEDLDYFEAGLDLAYTLQFATYNVSAYWSPDYSGNSGDSWFIGYSVDMALNDNFTLYIGTGWNGFEQLDNYLNSTFGLAYTYDDWAVDVSYNITDIADLDNSWVVSISKTF